MRAFLAVSVAEPALTPLLALRDDMSRRFSGVRWVEPEGMHVTLRFFPELDAADIPALMRGVSDAVTGMTPFPLTLAGLGTFPEDRRPRVLWVGMGEGAGDLSTLFNAVDDATESAGHGRERRAFAPHCTLGRPRQPWDGEKEWVALPDGTAALPSFGVTSVDLYESTDGYRVIASAPLGAAAVRP